MRGLIRRVGRRGAFLGFLAILDWVYGYSILAFPQAAQRLDLRLDWHVWGWAWVIMGFVTASGVLARRDRIQFTCSAAFKAAWALTWVDQWLVQHTPGAWISVVIWAAFAAIVLVVAGWPEPPVTLTAPEVPPAMGRP